MVNWCCHCIVPCEVVHQTRKGFGRLPPASILPTQLICFHPPTSTLTLLSHSPCSLVVAHYCARLLVQHLCLPHLDFQKLCYPHSIMAPATAASKKPNNVKIKDHTSRASSVSKPEVESPVSEANGTESNYLKDLQKFVVAIASVALRS